MNRLVIVTGLIFWVLTENLWAIDFSSRVLTSYEPSEVNNVSVKTNPDFSPSLSITWPVKGGEKGVPYATEGNYVLKLEWNNEADHKIEIRHDFNFTFGLADVNFLHVDVFIPDSSAMPHIMGIWDDVFGWVSAGCTPRWTNEWYTISMVVAGTDMTDLDHIAALILENMPGTSGIVYLDNLRLSNEEEGYCKRKILFSSRWWSIIQSDWAIGSGPNRFTDEPNDIFVDPNGYLHVSITKKDPNWYSSELILCENLGFGTYSFTIQDTNKALDPNVILGLFVYDPPEFQKYHEIDVEIATWGEPNNLNSQYVVQPWFNSGNFRKFTTDLTKKTTHEFTWHKKSVSFKSYLGDLPLSNADNLTASWCYTGPDIPEDGSENVRINFYLMNGKPPSDGQDQEFVIKSFRYTHIGDFNLNSIVNFEDFSLLASHWMMEEYCSAPDWYKGIDLTCDCQIRADDLAVFAEHWLEK